MDPVSSCSNGLIGHHMLDEDLGTQSCAYYVCQSCTSSKGQLKLDTGHDQSDNTPVGKKPPAKMLLPSYPAAAVANARDGSGCFSKNTLSGLCGCALPLAYRIVGCNLTGWLPAGSPGQTSLTTLLIASSRYLSVSTASTLPSTDGTILWMSSGAWEIPFCQFLWIFSAPA